MKQDQKHNGDVSNVMINELHEAALYSVQYTDHGAINISSSVYTDTRTGTVLTASFQVN